MLIGRPTENASGSAPAWIDLLNGTDAEIKEAERITGLRVPTRDALSEIESSSRVFADGDAIYLSMPLITTVEEGEVALLPVGFVVAPHVLLTVRFGPSSAYDVVSKAADQADLKAEDIFGRILEAMVDRAADRLEHAGVTLEAVSREIFRSDNKRRKDLAKASEGLRGGLRNIGRTGDSLGLIRDTLLGLERISAFTTESPRCAFSDDVIRRLKAVHADILSLNSYEEHLSAKVQFLLDATLGFINIEQNDIVKVLTVVSVVGVPPVLVAGIYGMNFKNMPEYNWVFGYPYSLILMAVSALVPIVWFKWRRWI